MLEGDWDIRYQPERCRPGNEPQFNAWLTEEEMTAVAKREGINSGTFAIRGAVFRTVMEAWARIDRGTPARDSGVLEQAAWNALLLRNTLWRTEPFPMGEVQFPGFIDLHPASYTKAAITHNIMPDVKEKVAFTFGLYMRTFYAGRIGEVLGTLSAFATEDYLKMRAGRAALEAFDRVLSRVPDVPPDAGDELP